MSNRKRKKYVPKSFESVGATFIDDNGTKRVDTSANIYDSMMLSKAYRDLKTRQQQLYTICKAQYYGKRKPKQDYADIEQFQDDTCFYLNLGNVVRYGLYTQNMRKEFYGDMKALQEHGFIIQISKGGGNGKTKSIYQFVSDWRTWIPPK